MTPDDMIPQALREAVSKASITGAALCLGVAYTTEMSDWDAVAQWHADAARLIAKKIGDTGSLYSLGPGRIVICSQEKNVAELDHSIRSALGFADLPTRIGVAALTRDTPGAGALLLVALRGSRK